MLEQNKMEQAKEGAPSVEDGAQETEQKQDGDGGKVSESNQKVLFQRHIAIFNVTDPARFFTAKLKKDEEFSLLFTNSAANKDSLLEV